MLLDAGRTAQHVVARPAASGRTGGSRARNSAGPLGRVDRKPGQHIGNVVNQEKGPSDRGQRSRGESMSGFKKFLLRGNLVDLAVAVVIGIAFNAVIQALIADLITPIISAIGGKPSFSSLSFTINHSKFAYGAFINVLLSFAIIAAVVYFFVVVPATKVLEASERKKEATERECPECLSKIPIAARRCMYCTAQLPPATESVAGASAP